jgi:polyisoprenoid-binding protein YceI
VKRTLSLLGALALLAWTGLGLVAWTSAARRVTIDLVEGAEPAAGEHELLALGEELSALRGDVRGLAQALGENLELLAGEIEARQSERASAVERELAELRVELAARTSTASPGPSRELASEPEPTSGRAGESAPEPAAEPAVEPVATRAAGKGSFLAFRLPSDEFRFDERRTWTLLPTLSRVGFDARSTLHDFSGTSSRLEGELEVDLSRPGEAPRGSVRVQAASLETGVEGRDEAMREHLATDLHPELSFALERFEPASIDAAARRVEGSAYGSMTIRGVSRSITMPLRLSVDDAQRLLVEGETRLRLSDYQVPVPNKLGVISMEDEVTVWISLRARAQPQAASGPRGEG